METQVHTTETSNSRIQNLVLLRPVSGSKSITKSVTMFAFQLVFVISHGLLARSYADFSEMQQNNSLQVAAFPFKPFLSQNEIGQFFDGIEFDLIRMIAEKVNFEVSFVPQLMPIDNNQQLFDNVDMIVGGVFPNVSFTDKFALSNTYYQDDMTWCIQRSGFYPTVLNFFLIASPECFILIIFGVGYGTGLILYIIIQFDEEYEYRNQRDWHYTTWLIMLPAVIGVNQRYEPRHIVFMVLYFIITMSCIAYWQIFFYALVRFLKVPTHRPQISTIDEIIGKDFRLCGSTEARSLILFDQKYKSKQISSYHVCEDLDRCLEHLTHSDNYDLAVGGSRQRILNSRFYSSLNCAGTILATLSLYAERLTFRKMKEKPQTSKWKLVAKFFDGKRYY